MINKAIIIIFIFLIQVPTLAAMELTEAEQNWLNSHQNIRYAPAPNYPPIEFFDKQGRFSGVTSDILHILKEKFNINFKIVKYNTWAEVVAATKQRKVDAWGCAAKNKERLKYMTFPTPYIYFPSVLIVRENIKSNYTIEDLAGKKVAVVKNYATHKYMKENFPDYNLIVVPDIETGLRFVSIGSADVMIVTNAVASYFSEKTGINNLRVAGVVEEKDLDLNLGFAVRSDWPELAGILQKAMDSISEAQKKEIFRKWISLKPSKMLLTKTQFILLGTLCLFLLFLFFFFWSITLKKKIQARTKGLQAANRELSVIFNNTPVGILYIVDRKIKRCNPELLRMTGYRMEELLGSNTRKILVTDEDYKLIGDAYEKEMKDGGIFTTEIQIKDKNNNIFWCCIIGQAEIHSGSKINSIWMVNDISVQKELEYALRKQAATDPLTGINNRRSFYELATKEMERGIRTKQPFSFLMLDIDHFKKVNDTYGHSVGDDVLKFFCRITNSLIRDYDIFGRLGGEEFGLYMPATDRAVSLKVAERIRSTIESSSFEVDGNTIQFKVSIGISTHNAREIGVSFDELITQADKALYEAKRTGRNKIKTFSS